MHQSISPFGGASNQKLTALLVALSCISPTIAQDSSSGPAGANCSFQAAPDLYVAREARVRELVNQRLTAFKSERAATASATVEPSSFSPANFIDEAIFTKMAAAGIASARLTTDEEFVRRLYLDLTGRIPTIEQYKEFLNNGNKNKRDDLIDRLLYSREYTDKWSVWWGDLLQNARVNSFRNQSVGARNNFYTWIGSSVSQNQSIRDIVFEVLTAKGNTEAGGVDAPTTWENRWRTPGGPIQDSYDTLFARSATAFLGMGHYDCLLCHDGRGHLDQLTLWGKKATRLEAYQMAAYFSRLRYTDRSQNDPEYPGSTDISDATSGSYNLNTSYGNRPKRVQIGTLKAVMPVWRMDDPEAASGDWRSLYAKRLTADRMFARNFGNRFWKELFGLGLVEPVDQLDPARLDPNHPPPAGWTLQATHPELLERLSDWLIENKFDMREYMRILVSSKAYQLSSDYGADWSLEKLPYFARHYPRRLEGEEIHDAIQTATNVFGKYTIGGWAEPVSWAMRMPEPVEPSSNTAVRDFMGFFLRGNRDTQFRSQNGSILQQLNLMNHSFVTTRAKIANSSVLKSIAGMTNVDTMVDELFLRFLGRRPSDGERAKSVAFLSKAGAVQTAKNTAVEDMAWVLMNKQEFIFSY
ncbi:DUF1549 domain-containing protein [Bryobacter aggregatus]|uniref:DUF1549 domain-containing protein n=1 Tax=Bryobacter aggregatus TaxID=360054 RepID=UPI0004E21F66|nr:DUF1549 domain-containing protein [Bryobacter aggregatus]